MASGSGSHGHRSDEAGGNSSRARATEAPLVGDAARLASQLNNPTLEALPAVDLVAHLNQYRRTEDFIDAGLVFAAREQQADRLIRERNERIHSLLDEIRAREYNAVEAEARIRRATEMEAALRAKIHSVQLSTMTLISALSGAAGAGLTQPATGPSREPPVLPQQFIANNTDAMGCSHDATDVQQTMNARGEVGGGDVPVKTGYIGAMWSRPAPHLVVAPPMRHEALSRAVPQLTAAPLPLGILIDDDKSRIIKAEDPVHAADDVGAHIVVPTGSPKKARRQKGVSFYNEVFKSEMEKRKLIAGNEENEESLKKKAAEAASKALYDRCFSQAPYLPAQLGLQTVKEDPGEEA